MTNLCVFASGRGSNFQSILDKIAAGRLNATIKLVVSDKESCGAFELAEKFNINMHSISNEKKDGFTTYDELLHVLKEQKINLIVLAGFLKKIPDRIIEEFENKIINIHPALLPSFGGKGMYGINVHKAVFEKSCQVSGATVHFVDKIYDNGKIIAQRAIDISHVRSPEHLAAEVLKIEHELLPFVIKKISENKVIYNGIRVSVLQ